MAKPLHSKGVTLVEALIYTALLAIIAATMMTFTIQVLRHTARGRIASIVQTNARAATAVITREIRHASAVYPPTSNFDSHPGQLSLVSSLNPPTDEDETYIDLYLDDDRLYIKREGEAAQLVTSEQVKVSNLVFRQLNQSANSSAIQVQLTVTLANTASSAAAANAVNISTTTDIRAF